MYAYPKNSKKKYGSAAIILNDLNQDFNVLQFINVKEDRMDFQKWTIQEHRQPSAHNIEWRQIKRIYV